MNTQFAVQAGEGGEDVIFLLEINPRASRTVPFVSKATGRPLAKIAARCMAGMTLAAQGVVEEIVPDYYFVKEAIFPFAKLQGVDPILGTEMSTPHKAVGVDRTSALAKATDRDSIGTNGEMSVIEVTLQNT